jgi:hypothetical protein
LDEIRKKRYVPSYWVAVIRAGLGQVDQTFELLEEAYRERSGWAAYASVDPRLDCLRADSRFAELMRKLGIEREKASHADASAALFA